MTRYSLEKDYDFLQSFSGRSELIRFRKDIRSLAGYGNVRATPVKHDAFTVYDIFSEDGLLDGSLEINYFVGEAGFLRILLPQRFVFRLAASSVRPSLDELVKKYELKTG